MNSAIRKHVGLLIAFLLGVFAVPVISAVLLVLGFWNTSYEDVVAKYRKPDSQFVELLGAKVHYLDQGRGAPVILIHGSYESFLEWEDVAKIMARDFRVIRYDHGLAGLTGPDPQHRYGREDEIKRLELLMNHLQIGKAAVVGISSGASYAAFFAAAHPERVSALVVTPASGLESFKTSFRIPYGAIEGWIHKRFRSKSYGTAEVHSVIAHHSWVTPAVQQEYADLNNRTDTLKVFWEGVEPSKQEWADIYAAVRAPVLAVWGLQNPAYLPEWAELLRQRLSNTSLTVITYADVGHKVSREVPDRFAADLAGFLGQIGWSGTDTPPQLNSPSK